MVVFIVVVVVHRVRAEIEWCWGCRVSGDTGWSQWLGRLDTFVGSEGIAGEDGTVAVGCRRWSSKQCLKFGEVDTKPPVI